MNKDRDLLKQALHTLEGWANHGEWVWPESALEQAKRNTMDSITALRERLAQPEQQAPRSDYRDWDYQDQMEQSPLDRMAENARELGLDYEPERLQCTTCGTVYADGVPPQVPEQEPVAWRDHVEQRLLTWRQSFVNRSGDQLALDDFMDKESLDDLIDYVCDEYTTPPRREPLDIREICASICDRVAVYERQATNFSEDSLPWASFCADLIRGKKVDA